MNIHNTKIAYFSAEIGISSSIPTYSGGLGILAGDHIKSSADIGLAMVGVSLLYKEGYFKQCLDDSGYQSEMYPRFDLEPKLKQLSQKFTLRLREREVWIDAYEYQYIGENGNKVIIYFLDTDLEENLDVDRILTLRLYSGDKNHRILQEAILGFGGIKLLKILGFNDIQTYHMNEGHCAFITLALLEDFNGNEEKVRSMCHFTTHTPVEAGHDHFDVERCRKLLNGLLPVNLQLPSWIQNNRLHMTELGLYFSRSANGVSMLHGKVAQKQFPEFNIDYITNGVYHPFWVGDSFRKLFDREIPDWRLHPSKLETIDIISDNDLKLAHLKQKQFLLSYVESQTQKILSEKVLTIGFARRAAEYKRARLLFSDLQRLAKIGKNKLQIIFAGKAHPNDKKGKDIIREIVNDANKISKNVKVVYLENYNIRLGRMITSGVDVWLNTPLRPNEASGTSGMKAALNGIPNFSIIDGWWAEACKHSKNGWAIGNPKNPNDDLDADSLYYILENDIIPNFYSNQKKWMQIMRSSISTALDFTAHRMINEYKNKFYNN